MNHQQGLHGLFVKHVARRSLMNRKQSKKKFTFILARWKTLKTTHPSFMFSAANNYLGYIFLTRRRDTIHCPNKNQTNKCINGEGAINAQEE